MSLSEKAESRKLRISEWIRSQIEDGGYNHDITSDRRRITEARIYGLGGLALSARYGSPANHVLNDDASWKIIARELKIPSDVFYSHLDLSAWNDIPNHEPTTTHFYRSKIEKGATMATIVPELVEGFPTYPAADIAIGSLQGDYPKQAVLDWLGLISIGGHRDNADGELGLSNDTRMRKLTFFQDETEIEIQVPRVGNSWSYFQRNTNSHSYSFGAIVLIDERARVVLGNSPIPISPSQSQGTLSFTIIAEDDTERPCEIQIIQI